MYPLKADTSALGTINRPLLIIDSSCTVVWAHSRGVLSKVPQQLIDLNCRNSPAGCARHLTPQQFACPDRRGSQLHFFFSARLQELLVIDAGCQSGMIFQHTIMTQYLRQLVISKDSELIKIGKSAPPLATKCAVEIGDTYLGTFEETYFAASIDSDIAE